eukprot:4256542-Amphidinium_carterae.1
MDTCVFSSQRGQHPLMVWPTHGGDVRHVPLVGCSSRHLIPDVAVFACSGAGFRGWLCLLRGWGCFCPFMGTLCSITFPKTGIPTPRSRLTEC